MDVHEEIVDRDANLFYDNVRTFIVVFLTVACLLPASYTLIKSRRKTKEIYSSKNDISIRDFVFIVSVLIISLCLIMVFMLPLSILANEVLILSPDRYYVQWINVGLLHAFFVLVRLAFKGSCLVIPFSFFLLFSHSAHKGKKGLTSRWFSSMFYVAVIYTASFGCLTVFISTIFDAINSPSNVTAQNGSLFHFIPQACFSSPNFYHSWPIQILGDVLCYVDNALLLTQRAVSYVGLALLLVCMPSGIVALILKMITFSHFESPHYDPSSTETYHLDQEYGAQLEKCLKYIKSLNGHFHQPLDQLVYQVADQGDNSRQMYPIKKELDMTPTRRPHPTLSTLAFVLIMIIFIASVLSTSVNIIVILYGFLVPRSDETSDSDYIILGNESLSKFGFLGAVLQVSF